LFTEQAFSVNFFKIFTDRAKPKLARELLRHVRAEKFPDLSGKFYNRLAFFPDLANCFMALAKDSFVR